MPYSIWFVNIFNILDGPCWLTFMIFFLRLGICYFFMLENFYIIMYTPHLLTSVYACFSLIDIFFFAHFRGVNGRLSRDWGKQRGISRIWVLLGSGPSWCPQLFPLEFCHFLQLLLGRWQHLLHSMQLLLVLPRVLFQSSGHLVTSAFLKDLEKQQVNLLRYSLSQPHSLFYNVSTLPLTHFRTCLTSIGRLNWCFHISVLYVCFWSFIF